MSWQRRFRRSQYLGGSLWFIPLMGGVVGSILATVIRVTDPPLPPSLRFSASTATSLLTTIIGAMVALTGFVVTVSVLVIQMATETFSARYMRLWYRDRMQKAVLATLIGALTFSFTTLRGTEADDVPDASVLLAGVAVAGGIVLFLLFLDRFVHGLRPVAVAAQVAEQSRRTLDSMPLALVEGHHDAEIWPRGEPDAIVNSAGTGSIQAIDERGLVDVAARRGCVLVFPVTVGDFVSAGSPLILVHGSQDTDGLVDRVALGVERTIEQDPAFGIRVMVDVAIRALSPAVNDPTTAIQVLDHLEGLLRIFGSFHERTKAALRDTDGMARVLMPVRSWPDILALALTEIREYGASSVQVSRRMRALLLGLLEDVRPEQRSAVEDEIRRLDAAVTRSFRGSFDLDLATTPDAQGIGGPDGGRA